MVINEWDQPLRILPLKCPLLNQTRLSPYVTDYGADGEDVFGFDDGDSFLCDLGGEGTAQVLGS